MHDPDKPVSLVTGASSGIGEAVVRALLEKGHHVYAAARRVERMQELEDAGASVHYLDLTEENSLIALVETIAVEVGCVDVLVNNAGFGVYGPVEEVPLDEARRQFEVNLFGLARLTQLLVPDMRERGSGRIVNISSVGGRIYTPMGAWYHASKHALEGWSDCLRLELAPFDIDVVVVEPGAIRTEFGEIAVAPLLERSKDGPYGEIARAMAAATREIIATRGSAPSVIANSVVKALEAKRPRTRYVAGHLARPLAVTRRIVGDRFFDRLIRTFL